MEPTKEPASLVILSSSPHIHGGNTVPAAMRDVIISLIPAVLAAAYYFHFSAISVILACVISAIVFEAALVCEAVLINIPFVFIDPSNEANNISGSSM